MRIAIDVHGTITRSPEEWKAFLKLLCEDHEVYILSGPQISKLYERLGQLGLKQDRHYHHALSVVDHLKAWGVTMEEKTPDHWWCGDDDWNNAKGRIAGEHWLDVVIDDMAEYEEAMPFRTMFVLQTRPGPSQTLMRLLLQGGSHVVR